MATLRMLLIVIFLIAALTVTIVVLLQEGKSAGLGSIGGSGTSGDSYWDKNKKYSLEGKFERWTKTAAIVFVLSAFVLMFIPTSTANKTENNNPQTEVTQPSESPTGETTDKATESTEKTEQTAGETNGGAGVEETTTTETPAQ